MADPATVFLEGVISAPWLWAAVIFGTAYLDAQEREPPERSFYAWGPPPLPKPRPGRARRALDLAGLGVYAFVLGAFIGVACQIVIPL